MSIRSNELAGSFERSFTGSFRLPITTAKTHISENCLTTSFSGFESYPVNPFGRSLFMQRAPKRYKLFGSNPSIPYFFGVLCRAKKRKKYTSIFDRFCVWIRKNRAPGRLIYRLKARNCLISPYFCPKCKKNPFCRGRQIAFL